MTRYCKWFKDIKRDYSDIAGEKGANLGEMFNASFPVPPGFVITTDAYRDFLKTKNLDKKIQDKLKGIDVENNEELQKVSKEIQDMILQYQMSFEMKDEIQDFYRYTEVDEELRNIKFAQDFIKAGREPSFVAVRSSGEQKGAVFLNIRGKDPVVAAVQECWASLFTPEAIKFRVKNNLSHKTDTAVVVQKQINAEKSGTVFSKDNSQILIEALWGLGDAGAPSPSKFVLEKESSKVLETENSDQVWMFTRDEYTGRTVKKNLAPEILKSQVLIPKEFDQLSELAQEVEKHFVSPQSITWAIEKNKVYLLQAGSIDTEPDVEPTPMPQPEAPNADDLGTLALEAATSKEIHPEVQQAVENLIKTCKQHGVETRDVIAELKKKNS